MSARNLITEASTFLAAAQSTEGQISLLNLANARLVIEAIKRQTAELEMLCGAREKEAVRVAKLAEVTP